MLFDGFYTDLFVKKISWVFECKIHAFCTHLSEPGLSELGQRSQAVSAPDESQVCRTDTVASCILVLGSSNFLRMVLGARRFTRNGTFRKINTKKPWHSESGQSSCVVHHLLRELSEHWGCTHIYLSFCVRQRRRESELGRSNLNTTRSFAALKMTLRSEDVN